MTRTTRTTSRLAAGLVVAAAATLGAIAPSMAAPVGPAGVSPVTGDSSTKPTFETAMTCKASDTVSVLVSGGTGTGAAVPTPGKVIVKSVPVASVTTSGGGMSIPSSTAWKDWATTGEPVLTRIDGNYEFTVQCLNGESYAGAVTFIGTNVADATYKLVAPSPSATTATATATETKTATATATTTAPEKPIAIPAKPPASNGPLTVTGTPLTGGTVTVSGEGFRPGSPITVGVYTEGQQLASAVADANGNASTPIVIPKELKGKHELVMLGYAPDGKERALTAEIDVLSAPNATIPAELPKSDGPLTVSGNPVAGGTVTVTGSGYKPGTAVAVGIYSTGRALSSAVADSTGVATTAVILPADYTGNHTLAMVGATTDEKTRVLTAEVTITAPASGGIPWWGWLIIAIAIIAIIGLIWALIARKRDRLTPWGQSLATQAVAAQRLATGSAAAISDRTKPVDESVALWNAELPMIQAQEAEISQLAQTAADQPHRDYAQRLLGSVVALRESLQTDIQLRASGTAADADLQSSGGIVALRREELSNTAQSVLTALGVGGTTAGGTHR